MENIIPIIDFHGQEGIQAVSARDLYAFLHGADTHNHFSRWAEKYITTNEWAIRGEDWVNATPGVNPQGGRPSLEFHLRLDFAKHVALQSHTEKGQEVRSYFIAVEKRAREISAVSQISRKDLAQWLLEAEIAKEAMQAQIAAQAPMVAYAEKVQASPSSFTVDVTAKELGLPVVKFREFVQEKFLFRRGRDWLPYAEHQTAGLFEVRTRTYDHNGVEIAYHTVLVTGLGRIRLKAAWDRRLNLTEARS